MRELIVAIGAELAESLSTLRLELQRQGLADDPYAQGFDCMAETMQSVVTGMIASADSRLRDDS